MSLDAKAAFSKQALFQAGWQEHSGDMVEWVSGAQGDIVEAIDPETLSDPTEQRNIMTPAQPSRVTRHPALFGLIGLALVGPSTLANAQPSARQEVDPAAAPQVDAPRLQALEQRVEDLVRRLERLESAPSSGSSTPSTSKTGEIHWTFDASLGRSPFNVTHQSFDRGSGRFDILLKVVDPLPNPLPWQVAIGAEVPVVARIGLADGTASEGLVFRLARGPRLEPGAILHLEAYVPIEQAGAISGLSVGMRRE